MKLARAAQVVIVVTVLGAVASVAALLAHYGLRNLGSPWVLSLLSFFILASWLWPIVMYQNNSSSAHHLDEGFFLVLALVQPPSGVLIGFLCAAALAQALRRRPLVKSVFNLAQIALSVCTALLVVHLIVPAHRPLSVASLGAGVVGACVYFGVNSLAIAAIMSATRAQGFVNALSDGIRIRLALLTASISLALVAALAISASSLDANAIVATLIVGLVFLVYRQTMVGHFQARHDRTRLLGLFDATLDVHRHMGRDLVKDALEKNASGLLRSPLAEVREIMPSEDALSARMTVQGSDRWLVVSGRDRFEPFDSADRLLLDALGAVGSGALENALLYETGQRQQERLVAITSSLGEGVCAFDSSGALTFMNPAAQDLLGWSEDEMKTQDSRFVGNELHFLVDPALRSMRSNVTIRSERGAFHHRSGKQFPVEITCSPIRSTSDIEGAVVAFRDISERVRFEEQLAYHAFHDELTRLPNRRVFLDRLQHALARSARTGAVHAVLFADVDRFKLANDSLGHLAGDQLLRVIGGRMQALAREGDTLARFGGDEFTLLLEEIESAEAAEAVAEQLLSVVRTPIVLEDGRTVMSTVSVGIALATAGATPDDVLHDADVAMYQAKRKGADNFEIFDAEAMAKRSADWIDIEAELHRAIEDGGLVAYFQPVFDTHTLAITGAEALVRWQHPSRGLLSPAAFIGLAEETGLILPIGATVLAQACGQAKAWGDEYDVAFNIAVNLSARQFQSDDLVGQIAAVLDRFGLEPERLCLEITETLALHDIDRSIELMTGLKSLGVRLAIDDFGTGYSSLNYLKRFPVDVVKLDQSFVHDLGVSAVDTAIVAAVVDLARTIGVSTVAEGVETEAQLVRLESLGCPYVQGYHLAKPLPAAEVSCLLSERAERGRLASGAASTAGRH